VLRVMCACGAVIPYRNLSDHYRLTPNHAEVRAAHALGSKSSRRKRFADDSEAATRSGETILHLSAFAQPHTRYDAAYRHIVKYCRLIGYLEFVCPQCGAVVEYKKRRKRRLNSPRSALPNKK